MKPTKMILVLWAAQLVAAQLVCAQDSPTPTPTVEPTPPTSNSLGKPSVGDMLSRMLSLTDAQKKQLRPYFDAVQPQFDAAHLQARQTKDMLLKKLSSSIRPLLTPQQQTKLDTFEAMRIEGPPSNPVGVMFGKDFEGASQ
jgi:Spy/CpxP family protein refolding chaperone